MIEVNEAYEIAKKKAEGFELGKVKDSGEMWIFCFFKRLKSGHLCPQSPNIAVNKETGKVINLVIPPMVNLYIINKAKTVDFKV